MLPKERREKKEFIMKQLLTQGRNFVLLFDRVNV
jgi:hypothetical protein